MVPTLFFEKRLQPSSANPTLAAEGTELFAVDVSGQRWIATYTRSPLATTVAEPHGSRLQGRLLIDVTSEAMPAGRAIEHGAALIRLLPNRLSDVEDWRGKLMLRLDEAKESIRREGVTVESWFLLSIEERDYLFAYMLRGAPRPTDASEDLPVDLIHHHFKRSWDRTVRFPCQAVLGQSVNGRSN